MNPVSDRDWLKSWQADRLALLRKFDFKPSSYANAVTAVIYAFLQDESRFAGMEFSILQTWKTLGLLPVAIVCDREYKAAQHLSETYPNHINIQIEPSLVPGKIETMSQDMIKNLYRRFETQYCLVIQDDGFPLYDSLEYFLGKWDYVGAPSIRDIAPFKQCLADIFRMHVLGGGLSLRSQRLCRAAAGQWKLWRHFLSPTSRHAVEDVFYTQTACINPLYRLRFRFASAKNARLFDSYDFNGLVNIAKSKTFGVHGPSAIRQRFENK
jgi:hypothetical protein